MKLGKIQSVAVTTSAIELPVVIIVGLLGYYLFRFPTLPTCMITSVVVTPIAMIVSHHIRKPRPFYDGDDVIMGAHRFRYPDAEDLAKAMALIGGFGCRRGEEQRGSDYETPMAMYPIIKENTER